LVFKQKEEHLVKRGEITTTLKGRERPAEVESSGGPASKKTNEKSSEGVIPRHLKGNDQI